MRYLPCYRNGRELRIDYVHQIEESLEEGGEWVWGLRKRGKGTCRALEHKRKLLRFSFDIIIVSPFAAIGVDVVGMHFLFDALSGDTPLDREGAEISLGGSGETTDSALRVNGS